MAHPEEPTLPEDTGQRKNKNMEELMKMIVRRTALAVCTFVLALILPTAASAACTGFDDVPETADCYESVIYLAEHEIRGDFSMPIKLESRKAIWRIQVNGIRFKYPFAYSFSMFRL